jgi:hypothetical protein
MEAGTKAYEVMMNVRNRKGLNLVFPALNDYIDDF